VVAPYNLDEDPAEVTLRLDGADPGARLVDLLADGGPL
jgi:hypothetical protein